MPRLDFFKKKFDESTVLARAKKRASQSPQLAQVIEILYFNPEATAEDVLKAAGASMGSSGVDEVRLRLMPQARSIIHAERARNTDLPKESDLSTVTSRQLAPYQGQDECSLSNLDEIEEQAITIVMRANTGVTLDARLKKATILFFKTFGPYAVLTLTIPESFWVFSRMYAHLDTWLIVMTWLFATLVDLGYTYLTVLLAQNKEAMANRQRSGLGIEKHERRAVRIQTGAWWVVAALDILAQATFMVAAVQGQQHYSEWLVYGLVGARIASLFLTMFIVSFAGTELMTSIDRVTTEQVERAMSIKKVMAALAEARQTQQQAKIDLEQAIAAQDLLREGHKLLSELYEGAREDVRCKQGLLGNPPNGQRKLN